MLRRGPGIERFQNLTEARLGVAPAAQRKTANASAAGIEKHYAADFVELGCMGFHISLRTNGSLLFSGEKDKTNRALRQHSHRLDRARCLNHQRGVAAVIQR